MTHEKSYGNVKITPGSGFVIGMICGIVVATLVILVFPESAEEKTARLKIEQQEWQMKFDREKQMLDAIGPYLKYMKD